MKPEDPNWINWPHETLQRQMEGEPLEGFTFRTPPWLERVQSRVIEDCFGRILGIKDKPDAYQGGFLSAWLDRSWRDVEASGNKLETLMEENPPLKELAEANEYDGEFEAISEKELEELEEIKQKIREHYGEDSHDIDIGERELFVSGYAEGFKTTHGDQGEKYYKSRLKTDLFVTIWMLWPSIMHHKNATVTWQLLCFLHGVEKVGDLEAFRQLLKRFKIRIGGRGRPRKKK